MFTEEAQECLPNKDIPREEKRAEEVNWWHDSNVTESAIGQKFK